MFVKTLPNVKWSNEFDMPYIENNYSNLATVYKIFKGVAWVNGGHFFPKSKLKSNQTPVTVDDFRHRKPIPNYLTCPESYLQKLELKHYAMNTAKTYIQMFEKFMNYHKERDLNLIDKTT